MIRTLNDECRLTTDSRALLRAATLVLCFFALLPAVARAQASPQARLTPPPEPKSAAPKSAPQSAAGNDVKSAAQKYFTDVELVDQDGKTVRLYSDLIKDKVVVVNAFFATCQGSCLPMNRNLEKVQEALRARMGKDLFIISISVDPEVDTPALLKEYARKLNAAPGRYFITGKKENVDWALYKLGQYVEQKEQHTNVFIVGNERTGLWKKVFGLAKPEEIVKSVESVLDDKAQSGGAK